MPDIVLRLSTTRMRGKAFAIRVIGHLDEEETMFDWEIRSISVCDVEPEGKWHHRTAPHVEWWADVPCEDHSWSRDRDNGRHILQSKESIESVRFSCHRRRRPMMCHVDAIGSLLLSMLHKFYLSCVPEILERDSYDSSQWPTGTDLEWCNLSPFACTSVACRSTGLVRCHRSVRRDSNDVWHPVDFVALRVENRSREISCIHRSEIERDGWDRPSNESIVHLLSLSVQPHLSRASHHDSEYRHRTQLVSHGHRRQMQWLTVASSVYSKAKNSL